MYTNLAHNHRQWAFSLAQQKPSFIKFWSNITTFYVLSRLNVGKNDLLTFYDGDDLTANILGQYSGTRPHFKLFTSMADVTIQFQSDPATNIYGYNNGFVVHFFGMTLDTFFCLFILQEK